jgi:hypothetical protein
MRPLPALGALLLVACSSDPAPRTNVSADTARAAPETLPMRHRPINGVLSLDAGRLRRLGVGAQFRYVGGERFILGGSADAEQHLFVVADSARVVQRLYWIQLEEYLPSESGAYDYSADSVVMVDGFALSANYRTYMTPPDPGSDRARVVDYLSARGYTVPSGATRVRLVWLPESPARREVMIVYLESSPSASTEPRASFLARAAAALELGDSSPR